MVSGSRSGGGIAGGRWRFRTGGSHELLMPDTDPFDPPTVGPEIAVSDPGSRAYLDPARTWIREEFEVVDEAEPTGGDLKPHVTG